MKKQESKYTDVQHNPIAYTVFEQENVKRTEKKAQQLQRMLEGSKID